VSTANSHVETQLADDSGLAVFGKWSHVQKTMDEARAYSEFYDEIIANQVLMHGDTTAVRRRAASLAYLYIGHRRGTGKAQAIKLIRVYKRFGTGQDDVLSVFNTSEMSALAGHSDETVVVAVRAKRDDPAMTRESLAKLLRAIRATDEGEAEYPAPNSENCSDSDNARAIGTERMDPLVVLPRRDAPPRPSRRTMLLPSGAV
jgi:hypothetical protein